MASWKCAAKKGLPIASHDWDGAAAAASIFSWAGWPDNPDPTKARQGFLAYDADAPELKGSYKLPFAEYTDRLQAVDAGLRAAASRLPQADLPQTVQDAARAVLDDYFARLAADKEKTMPPDSALSLDGGLVSRDGQPLGVLVNTSGMLILPAETATRGPGSARSGDPAPDSSPAPITEGYIGGTPAGDTGHWSASTLCPGPVREGPVYATEAQIVPRALAAFDPNVMLEKARRRAPDPSIFSEKQPYFWRAEISSNRLDAYYTQMSPKTTLPNFAADAELGVSFQNSHNWRSLGFGQSLAGQFIGASGNGIARAIADFYTIPGLRLNDVTTDDMIDAMRAGVVRDVSVGFSGGSFICSICGRDMLQDWDCPHIPGLKYNADDPDEWKPDPNGVLCTATVENARLNEVSAVYDGATPGAAILKATAAAEQGRMTASTARLLESRYRINLPPVRQLHAGAVVGQSKEELMGATTQPTGDPAERTSQVAHDAVRSALILARLPDTLSPDAAITQLATERDRLAPFEAEAERLRPLLDEVATLRGLAAEVERLRPLAAELEGARGVIADGRQYRADLIASALAEGIRAYGQDFPRATYEPILRGETTPLEFIKRLGDDWRALGDAKYPAGARTTQTDEDPPASDEPARERATRHDRPIPDAAYVA